MLGLPRWIAGGDMRVLVLAISLLIQSWGVLAYEPESLSDRSSAENVINLGVSSPSGGSAYSRIQGEIILPAQRQWPSLRKGCEPLELREILARGTGREFIATEWLRKNALQCSKTDLMYVANNVQNWSDFAMYDAIRLAYHYAQQIQEPE
jgi:hypothetical protein